VLSEVRLPLLSYDEQAFERTGALSYRLHCLYAAARECSLPFELIDNAIRSHWVGLLSELLRLYDYSEAEARKLFADVLPRGFKDVLGIQIELYFVPSEPPVKVRLADSRTLERYEDVKARLRSGSASAEDERELQELMRLLHWEDRINGPIPPVLKPEPWPGVSDEAGALKAARRHLSLHRGQGFEVTHPVRASERCWRVDAYFSPPPGARPEEMGRFPSAWARPGRHPAGQLWVDAVTGEVTESPLREHAAVS
jgi:hypothetical protein